MSWLSPPDLTTLRIALGLAVPSLYLLAALAAFGQSTSVGWRWAGRSATTAALVALVSLLAWAVGGDLVFRGQAVLPLGDTGAVTSSVRSDLVGSVVLLLVTFIGWVIVRYSRTYLAGEPRQERYVRALLATLASVCIVVVTNNLAVLALAWLGTSLALHRLLTFYGDRPQALVAAHKKFLASRLGDVCLLTAIGLVGHAVGSLDIDIAVARAAALPGPTAGLQAAAILFAFSALLKCAQLPIHGWLIQVMEAPTPVSALLHAGVVNLGGFLLIRVGSLVADVAAAQTLLVVVGSVTAVVAALVMTTRISVKVMLAWSTCAQMGFMLMQCGLGAYGLALLHLVAHSLYKAYAFLAAGGAVEQARLRQMTPPDQPIPLAASVGGAVGGLVIVTAAGWLWGVHPVDSPGLWALASIVCLALAPLLSAQALRIGGLWPAALIVGAFAVAVAYFGLHEVLGQRLDGGASASVPSPGPIAWVLFVFVLLFIVQSLIRAKPHGRVARTLYPWFYGGLYLDELFTRLTFRIWPARLSQPSGFHRSTRAPATSGVA